ncbi:Receptor-like cytosolic serine/threonine-protein kinase rbk2 [Stylosanthes scabra]|uniref:Receptor-like cytosolic serine/threonine-protein kinase rbk2 n=1 Tax=Stylosanthes scabra TaxID=79078 RepID=A0ABU6SFM2_9FABA|nr:Receptor-like cytosolic serine/threonine-protein kinase rbk2 [Stylosanthes scabra]
MGVLWGRNERRNDFVLAIAYEFHNLGRNNIVWDIGSENESMLGTVESKQDPFQSHKHFPLPSGEYFAPEYCMHGIVDEKTDIFSFGVLLLEIVSGRPALDDMQKSLVLWAKPLLEAKNIEALVDPSLGDDYDKDQIGHVVLTASKCIDQSPLLRPCMSEVVALLRGDDKCELESTSTGQSKALQRTYSEELLDAQEYNSTKYLRDLSRHRQLALGTCES